MLESAKKSLSAAENLLVSIDQRRSLYFMAAKHFRTAGASTTDRTVKASLVQLAVYAENMAASLNPAHISRGSEFQNPISPKISSSTNIIHQNVSSASKNDDAASMGEFQDKLTTFISQSHKLSPKICIPQLNESFVVLSEKNSLSSISEVVQRPVGDNFDVAGLVLKAQHLSAENDAMRAVHKCIIQELAYFRRELDTKIKGLVGLKLKKLQERQVQLESLVRRLIQEKAAAAGKPSPSSLKGV